MVKAFVFGKFLPFHKGHEAMIQFALTQCDFLTVLVCCSDTETIPGILRQQWVEKSVVNAKNIEVKCFNYLESEFPNTSISSKEVSKVWSEKFSVLFPDYSKVITSEAYGNYVANFMDIEHVAFNPSRDLFPVSASSIRNDLFTYWNFLPSHVKPYFALKVAVLGTESTGKSTLTDQLAKHFNCSSVQEVARDLIADSNSFTYEEISHVAKEHAKRINETIAGNSPLVIIDTDVHITKSYAQFVFGKVLEVDDDIYNSNKADLTLYLNNDVEFVQDGTRLSAADRNALDVSHRKTLHQHSVDFVEINGNWQERFEKARDEIEKLISR